MYTFDENASIEKTRYSLKKVHEFTINEDVNWRDMAPSWAESGIDAIAGAAGDIDIDPRKVLPDVIEDEALEAYEHIIDFLDSARENYGEPAYDMISDKLDQITGGTGEEVLEKAKIIAKEIGGDLVKLSIAGIPIIGTPIAVSYVLYNLGELQIGQGQARRAVDKLSSSGSESDVRELERVSSQLFDDYIDLMQAGALLIPFFGIRAGVGSLVKKAADAVGAGRASSFLG